MAAPSISPTRDRSDVDRWTAVGYGAAVLLIAAAMAVPAVLGWDVEARDFPPLDSLWDPRIGPGTLPAIAVGAAGVAWAPRLAAALPWRRLLLAVFVYEVVWMVSLATVDGWDGIGAVLDGSNEYLQTARSVTDFSTTLHEYVGRIPIGSAGQWPVHVAGHPPGALLFFVVLVALGLGSGLAAGWVVLLIAATTPVAVLTTVRRLGAEDAARRAAPFLVVCPAAIWMAVSADAMFGAVAAWGLCCLAFAATSRGPARLIAWSVGAGLLLGYCVMLSYGLPLLGVLALAVLVVARNLRPLPWAAAVAAAVVLAFAVAGFSWWDAYPVLRTRYWDGIAAIRPASYWLWGDLAALCVSAGPALGVAIALTVRHVRRRRVARDQRAPSESARVLVVLAGAAALCVVLADLSLMSKAETERIWLPFVPWLLLGTAFAPDRWRRPLLGGQVVLALAVQTLLFTRW